MCGSCLNGLRAGRLGQVTLVDPRAVKSSTRVSLLHALVHAESYAIDLSWDMVARFGPRSPRGGSGAMPREFFDDWSRIAGEESRHYSLWHRRLGELGRSYGFMPAHAALWEAALKTSDDVLERLAVVHMVIEARGLDTFLPALARLERGGDEASVAIIKANHEEEVTHVGAGLRWFRFVCAERGIDDAIGEFHRIVRAKFGALKPPFNHAARLRAGMGQEWYMPLAMDAGAGAADAASAGEGGSDKE
jgi:uncharacterized ferritin-like protein (DUF455 family)